MWWWVLIWAVLVVVAGIYLGARLWGLWGQTKELGRELALAQRRLEDVQGQLERLGEAPTTVDDLAVFADPADARSAREAAREAGRRERRLRRRSARPAWAKHVD